MSSFTTSAGDPDAQNDESAIGNVDYYAILGVTKEATKEEIKKAFKKLALTFHPDKFMDEKQRDEAQARFKEIKDASDVLLNDSLRALYDDFGAEAVKTQMNMQVGRKMQSNQDFLRDMFRMRRQQHQDYIMRRVDHTGNFMVLVNATNLKNQVKPEMSTISFRQSVKFPLTASSCVRLGFNALMNDGVNKASVKMTYERTFVAIAAAGYISLRVGWQGWSGRAGFSKTLWEKLHGDMSISFDEGEPRLRLKVTRQVTENWNAVFETNVTKTAPTIRLSAVTRPDLQWGALATVQVKMGSIESALRYSYQWSDRTRISAEVGYDNNLVEIIDNRGSAVVRRYGLANSFYFSGHAERTVSQLTSAHVGFTIAPHGVFVTPGFTRHGQTFSVPVMVNHIPTLQSGLIAVLAPMAIGLVLEAIILEPRRRKKRLAQEEKRRKQKEAQVTAAKARAEADCRLMADEVMRKREFEEDKGGLVILQAFYGRHPDAAEENLDLDDADEERSDRVDVTLPVQYMIQNSQLQISSGNSKAAFIGFYDPIPDEDKWIEIVYLYRHKTHRVLAYDLDALRLPLKSHQMD